MKKLLVSDYDGTFYINDEDIACNIKLLKKFMTRNIFVIATGRTYLDFIKEKIKYNPPYHYLVINHGATIIYCDHTIYNNYINNDLKNDIIKFLDKNKYNEIFCSSKLESRIDSCSNEITKIHIKYNDVKKAKEIYDKLIEKYGNKIKLFLVNNDTTIEIVNGSVDKARAVKFIMEKERIKAKRVYTVGDSVTDSQMISDFNGYMMTNCNNKKMENIKCSYVSSVSELIKKLS